MIMVKKVEPIYSIGQKIKYESIFGQKEGIITSVDKFGDYYKYMVKTDRGVVIMTRQAMSEGNHLV